MKYAYLDQIKFRKTFFNPWLLNPIKGAIRLENGDIESIFISHCFSVGGELHLGFDYSNRKYSTRPASEIEIDDYEKHRIEKLIDSCIKSGHIKES